MKPVIESKQAWDILLRYWNDRDNVKIEDRCPVMFTYPDGRDESQCVLHKSHMDGEALRANIPHADGDGNMASLHESSSG